MSATRLPICDANKYRVGKRFHLCVCWKEDVEWSFKVRISVCQLGTERGYCVWVPACCALCVVILCVYLHIVPCVCLFCTRACDSCVRGPRVVLACVLFVCWIWKSIWYPIDTLPPTIGTRYVLTPEICLLLLWIKCLVSTIYSSLAVQFELILLVILWISSFLSLSFRFCR